MRRLAEAGGAVQSVRGALCTGERGWVAGA
jgi:hypothetical protein